MSIPDYIDPARQRAARFSDFMEDLITSGKRFPVLDDGFIQVIDYMGTDKAPVNAARLTAGTLKPDQDDRGLLRYLIRNRHSTPIEFCELVLHIRIPMDAWRQYIRHRTASVNEYSTRYSPAIDARAQTPTDGWRAQSGGNRQGSSGFIDEKIPEDFPTRHSIRFDTAGEYLTARENQLHELSTEIYEERLKLGVAKEVARKDLPLSTYTEAYWKCDLHNLLHFLGLRMDPHAQKEIRDYANIIGNEIVAHWCPLIWEAFNDFRMGSLTLTRLDLIVLTGDVANAAEAGTLMTKRERAEFVSKIKASELITPERQAMLSPLTVATKKGGTEPMFSFD